MRAVKLKKIWLKGEDGITCSTKMVGIEITLTLATIIYGIYGK